MKTKSFVPAVVALTLLLLASSSMAATILDSLGETAAAAAADRTNMINPDTKYVNVQTSHKFDVGGKKFTWDYYGIHMAF
jgi:hypothetical protein